MINIRFDFLIICVYLVFFLFLISKAQYSDVDDVQIQANSTDSVLKNNSTVYFTIRYGQGGF